MLKEKLTIDNIKQDLSVEAKKGYKELAEMSAVFIGVFLLILFSIKVGLSFNSVFVWLLCCCGEVALLAVIIKQIKKVIVLHKNLKNNNAIVKDKLIYTETKSKRHGKIRVMYYYLHFSQYGRFEIPDENYKWSENFTLTNRGVYNYANNDDEFYLVLSKPHNGKILLAYNTKMFEMK